MVNELPIWADFVSESGKTSAQIPGMIVEKPHRPGKRAPRRGNRPNRLLEQHEGGAGCGGEGHEEQWNQEQR